MVTRKSIDFDQVLEEIIEVTANRPDAPVAKMVDPVFIQQAMRQCYTLLRQALEYRVKREPDLYSRDLVEDVLQKFESAVPDIQEFIAAQIAESASEVFRHNVRGVLREAMDNLQRGIGTKVSEGKRVRESTSPTSSVFGEDIVMTVEPKAGGGELVGEELYSGDIKVGLESPGGPKPMVGFLNQLRSNPQLRVLRLAGNYQSASVLLALRQPLQLKELFYQAAEASKVNVKIGIGSGQTEHVLDVVIHGLAEEVS